MVDVDSIGTTLLDDDIGPLVEDDDPIADDDDGLDGLIDPDADADGEGVTTPVAPVAKVPGKFAGKTVDEIAASYANLETELGRLRQEIGTLRQAPPAPVTPPEVVEQQERYTRNHEAATAIYNADYADQVEAGILTVEEAENKAWEKAFAFEKAYRPVAPAQSPELQALIDQQVAQQYTTTITPLLTAERIAGLDLVDATVVSAKAIDLIRQAVPAEALKTQEGLDAFGPVIDLITKGVAWDDLMEKRAAARAAKGKGKTPPPPPQEPEDVATTRAAAPATGGISERQVARMIEMSKDDAGVPSMTRAEAIAALRGE